MVGGSGVCSGFCAVTSSCRPPCACKQGPLLRIRLGDSCPPHTRHSWQRGQRSRGGGRTLGGRHALGSRPPATLSSFGTHACCACTGLAPFGSCDSRAAVRPAAKRPSRGGSGDETCRARRCGCVWVNRGRTRGAGVAFVHVPIPLMVTYAAPEASGSDRKVTGRIRQNTPECSACRAGVMAAAPRASCATSVTAGP